MAERATTNAEANTSDWQADPRFAPLFDELLATVVKQYRIEAANAHELLAASLTESKLRAVVDNAASPAEIRRTRIYKDAAAAAKRHIYHALRQYRQDGDRDRDALIARLRSVDARTNPSEFGATVRQLIECHASTRERIPSESEFYDFLVEKLKDAATILDIGCGVQPLRFPFALLPDLRRYTAVDSNERSIATLAAFAAATNDKTLHPIRDDLTKGWQPIVAVTLRVMEQRQPTPHPNEFDAALLLKLIPVIARQSRELLSTLVQTPARRWIITGSTTGLAKRTSIQRREQAVLKRFVADGKRKITEEFTFGEEFGYIVE